MEVNLRLTLMGD